MSPVHATAGVVIDNVVVTGSDAEVKLAVAGEKM
jgi:hypothetical protein